MQTATPNTASHSSSLHRFALLTAVCTFPLIFIGGLVTSKGAGLAVPDWPNTYGYNMFLFPPSKWVGNILYEHGHRLFASFVGLLTTILAIWMWRKEPRRWARWLGVIAFGTVLFQGILGGLRVVLLKSQIGIFHACLAQSFFCLVVAIAFVTSRWWTDAGQKTDSRVALLRTASLITTVVVFGQLALGATMRHTQSGLAIPDFPLAYGSLLPPTTPAELQHANDERAVRWQLEPVTPGQIGIHFAHRVGAVAVSISILGLAALVFARCRDQRTMLGIAVGLVGLLALQIFLGAWTVLSGKAADVATAHVAVGALILAGSFSLTLISYRLFAPLRVTQSSVLSPQSSVFA